MNNFLQKNRLPLTTLKHYRQNFCFPIQAYWRGLGFQFTDESFDKLNQNFIFEYQKKMFLPKPHEGLFGFLKTLKKNKKQQFVLSASEQKLLNKSVAHYDLSGFFHGVYGVDNLNALGKKELGLALCRKHNLKTKETVLIGDTEYDKEVAEVIGCEVILVSHGHINHQRLLKTNRTVVASVDDLKNILSPF
jgi:phosphoglycolate phosphatase